MTDPKIEAELAQLRGDIRWWAKESGYADPDLREHVDRPEWAYSEDGYCLACGNGRWKSHNYWCEIAYLIDRAVAADDPLYGTADD